MRPFLRLCAAASLVILSSCAAAPLATASSVEVPGMVSAIPHIVSGTFEGAILGFSTFCVLFGLCMLFVRPRA